MTNSTVAQIIEASRPHGWVVEPLARRVLASFGIPVNPHVWAKSREEALVAAKTLGFPLAIKVVSPQIIHKSDCGGVAVGIKSPEELLAAFDRMSALPGFDGILVDGMAKGVELILGSKQDPQFGAVVLVGIGGTSVELYKDVAIRMAPLSIDHALGALSSLKAGALLGGYRGTEPVDKQALARLMADFSRLAFELGPVIESIDLNPVFCNAKGCAVADARFILAK